MKFTLLLVLGLFIQFQTYSQNLIYEMHEVSYIHCIEEDYIKDLDNFEDFPISVKNSINGILKNAVGSHFSNFAFKGGRIYEVEAYFKKYPELLNSSCGIIPSYVFVYIWTDLKIGIKSFEVYFCVDKLGQIINSNFPRHYDFENFDFQALDISKQRADSIINMDSIKFKEPEVGLYFNKCKNDFTWTFYYCPLIDTLKSHDRQIEVFMINKTYRETNLEKTVLGELDEIEMEEEILEYRNNKP